MFTDKDHHSGDTVHRVAFADWLNNGGQSAADGA